MIVDEQHDFNEISETWKGGIKIVSI